MKSLLFVLAWTWLAPALIAQTREETEPEESEVEESEMELSEETDDSGTPIVLQIPLINLAYTMSRSEGETDRFWTQTISAHESSYLMFETDVVNIYVHPFQTNGAPLSLSRYFWEERLELGVSLGLSRSDEKSTAFRDVISGGWVTYYQLLGSDFIMELTLGGYYEGSRTETLDEDDALQVERSSLRTFHAQGVVAFFHTANLHLLSGLTWIQQKEEYEGTVEKSYGMTLLPLALRVFL